MSQYSIASSSVVPPPSVPTHFTADDATVATPVANNLNISTSDTTANNDNGILGTASGSTFNIKLTNRQTGTLTTSDATSTAIITFPLGATPGVYYFEGNIVAFDSTDAAGGAYTFISGFRTTGAVATEISTEFKDVFEEAAMAAADFSISADLSNNFVLSVVGIAGKTIDWNVYLTFRMVT